MFDDLDLPATCHLDEGSKAAFVVSAIGPNELETRKAARQRFEQEFPAIVILDVGFMHQHVYDQPIRVDEDMPFAPLYFLPTVISAYPPFWLVFTDWLSIIAALGVGSRPCDSRTCSRKVV